MATVPDKAGVNIFVDPHIPSPLSRFGDPATKAVTVVPSDTVDLPFVANIFQSGGGGTITLMAPDGSQQQFTLAVGGSIEFRAKRVMATGTAATLIVAMI